MYAVIKDRGKQYTVRQGERVRLDLMAVAPGEALVFDEVLLLTDGDSVQVGQPHVAGASVKATVIGLHLDPKLIIFKKKRRKKYRRKQGHRQRYTDVVVDSIS